MSKPETDLQKKIIKLCQRPWIWLLRVNSGVAPTRRGYLHLAPEGTSDIIGWRSSKTWRSENAR
jgi:hypothetical protein